jgi:chitinase
LALPSDLGAIRRFDAKSLEKYVDMFEFMAYDLNWGSATARGHTDFRDIEDIAFPLWTSGINISKVNLGLAYYGRGFTLDDPGCEHENCNGTPYVKDGPCTRSGREGILSLNEIKRIVKDRGFSPKPIPEARYKEIAWDGQWIGYDDEETLLMKRTWASSRCFGGTMIWSIDYYNHGKI